MQTLNLKQGVTGADAAAAVQDLETSQQDKQKGRTLVLEGIFYTL